MKHSVGFAVASLLLTGMAATMSSKHDCKDPVILSFFRCFLQKARAAGREPWASVLAE